MDWNDFIKKEQQKEYYKIIASFLQEDEKKHIIYPEKTNIFNAFKYPLDNIKVVILGQDPYINPNEAHGLAFSVMNGIKIPPSLKNIFKELKSDLNIDIPNHGCLTSWAEQGVFLLNSTLTVRAGQSNSHQHIGWQTFTTNALKLLNNRDQPTAFLLWGAHARSKREFLINKNHLVLEAAHPSPFSCSKFFGCIHFSKANNFLIEHNIEPINWKLVEDNIRMF